MTAEIQESNYQPQPPGYSLLNTNGSLKLLTQHELLTLEIPQQIRHVKCVPLGLKITEVRSRMVASWRVTGKLGQEVVSRRLTVIHRNLICTF